MDYLSGVHLKLSRARERRRETIKAIERFAETRPYAIAADIDAKTGEQVWRVRGAPAQPNPEIGPIIGECLYDFRSALDHLAWQAVIRAGNKPSRRTAFPIFDDIEGYTRYGLPQIVGMNDVMTAMVEWLQPCFRRHFYCNGWLRSLDHLGNIDKHRHLNLTAAAAEGYIARPGLPAWGQRPTVYTGPVEDGTEIVRFAPDQMQMELRIPIVIAFSPVGPLPDHGNVRDLIYGIEVAVIGVVNLFQVNAFPDSIPFPQPAD